VRGADTRVCGVETRLDALSGALGVSGNALQFRITSDAMIVGFRVLELFPAVYPVSTDQFGSSNKTLTIVGVAPTAMAQGPARLV
jgi:hypothetical protein